MILGGSIVRMAHEVVGIPTHTPLIGQVAGKTGIFCVTRATHGATEVELRCTIASSDMGAFFFNPEQQECSVVFAPAQPDHFDRVA